MEAQHKDIKIVIGGNADFEGVGDSEKHRTYVILCK
jgi:hypothetical protein